jgi:hypothetical protein
MMTIREYFATATTEEEFLDRLEEEIDLYDAIEREEVDLEEWATAHDVDLTAIDERTGELVVTLWAWDMCGE